MKSVKQILEAKKPGAWNVPPTTTVLDAVREMAEHHIGALMVLDRGRVAGIVSERDCVRSMLRADGKPDAMPVSEVMTQQVVYVRPDHSIEECMALMTNKGIRHLPVLDGERLVGVVSMRDVVREYISEKEFMIQQLENYINGQAVG